MRRARDPTAGRADRRTAARMQETVNAHLAALGQVGDCGAVLADDVTLTMMETGEITRGRAAVAALLDYLHRQAFAAPPIVSSLATGSDRVMIEAEFAGPHAGEFAGILPTGRRVRVPYVVAYDLDAGEIEAMRLYLPMDSLVRQLRDT
jgi:predicted ester cyclase